MNNSLHLPLSIRQQLFKEAAAFPRQLELLLMNLSEDKLKQRLPSLEFSLHEQVWHLADLEIEGFTKRIQILLKNTNQLMPDFKGSEVAATRQYHTLAFQHGLRVYADARLHNLWLLSAVTRDQWSLCGVQDEVGEVTLADVFRSMVAHDQYHRREIEFLLNDQNAVGQITFQTQEFAAA